MNASVSIAACLWMLAPGVGLAQSTTPTAEPIGWRSDSLRPSDSWNTFTADLRVGRRYVANDGTALGGAVPQAQYRIERSNLTGTWKTVVTVQSIERAPRYPMEGTATPAAPVSVFRVELDDDGSPMRAYDLKNRLLRPFKPTLPTGTGLDASFAALLTPASAPRPRSTGREWLNSIVATTAGTKDRRLALERKFGTFAKGQLPSTLSTQTGDRLQTLTLNRIMVVPTEITEARSGVRTMRETYRYGPASSDGIVRLGTSAEVQPWAQPDARLIVDTSISNIALERR